MADERALPIPPAEVARRLRDLSELYELWKSLRTARFVGEPPPDRVRERPDERK